jgi:hypothetical protein
MRPHLMLTTNLISFPPRPARSSKSPRAPGARTPRLRGPIWDQGDGSVVGDCNARALGTIPTPLPCRPEFVGRSVPARFALAPSALDFLYWLHPQSAAVSRGCR